MRELSPETDAVVGLFSRCYERRLSGFDAPTWQLVALPEAGAMADQDAWTMAALAWVRNVWNRLESDLIEAATKRAKRQIPEMADGD